MPERMRFRKDKLAWRVVGSEAVIVDLRGSSWVLFLNATATLLWKALEHGAAAGDLVAALEPCRDFDAARAAEDVARWLRELDRLDLLEPTADIAPAEPAPRELPYESPILERESAFCRSAGCGKSLPPTQFSCELIPRDS